MMYFGPSGEISRAAVAGWGRRRPAVPLSRDLQTGPGGAYPGR